MAQSTGAEDVKDKTNKPPGRKTKAAKPPTDPKLLKARRRLRQAWAQLRPSIRMLQRFRDEKRFRQPNSDYHENCKGCDRNPYNTPPHADDCIVVDLERLLAKLED